MNARECEENEDFDIQDSDDDAAIDIAAAATHDHHGEIGATGVFDQIDDDGELANDFIPI